MKDYESYLKVFYRKRYIKKNVITKYAFATRVGYIPNNPNKVNQDSYILVPGIQGPEVGYKHFFGVCDGHGSNGHHASGLIKEQLPQIFKKALQSTPDDKGYEKAFIESFLECDDMLDKQQKTQ